MIAITLVVHGTELLVGDEKNKSFLFGFNHELIIQIIELIINKYFTIYLMIIDWIDFIAMDLDLDYYNEYHH